MIKKLAIFIVFVNVIFGQISMSDINKISNSQLDLIRQELKDQSSDQAISDSQTELDLISVVPQAVNIESSTPISDNLYFGYNYFKRDISFFDNIPTPSDFRLGPGDEIILSLWGESNSRENFVINKDGLIYYENIGFINISNKTIKEAELILKNELSRVYSTLGDKSNKTQLMLELGKLKSINVYFSGQVENPGINLVHPFSDVFSAIVQSGGVKEDGSLRQVQLIRLNKIISTIDFYSFFTDGKDNFSNIRILDGDVIHIPAVSIRAEVRGEVLNEGFFELLNNESVSDLVSYAGGFTANASSTAVLDMIIPISERSSNDNAKNSATINFKEFSNTDINNGDVVTIYSIPEVETKVEILGRVKFPGMYPASSSLFDILNMAGGFDDPLYRKTIRDDEIIIVRKDENQLYGLEFQTSYDESNKFELVPSDKIFVYENTNYDNLFLVSVSGEVNKRGSFQLKKGMTVGDAINLAEGLTQLANEEAITVMEVFTTIDNSGNTIQTTTQVNDATLSFELTDGSIVNVLPLENVVSIQGNVYNPGLVTYTGRQSIKKYIELAGGMKKDSLVKDIYVERANGRIKHISRINGLYITAKPGDTIVVPIDETPQDFDITAFTADLATTLANIAAILLIVDNQKD